MAKPIICLMGPTASGKTDLAVELVQHFPFAIVSVDSAMVYREMDIGTAKPNADILQLAPHRLIDITDPGTPYSAGDFYRDVLREIEAIYAQNKIPLLVGGTMLYFRVLSQGIANLPAANVALRLELQKEAEQLGWESLHAALFKVDPISAARIQVQDGQRIQRALEVYRLTGKPISVWQKENTQALSDYHFTFLALMPNDRMKLHARIAERFMHMLKLGFIEEVEHLLKRGDLSPDLPSIRSVGYAQIWNYLTGFCTRAEMQEKAIAATRQLAKRQMTWLRSWPDVIYFESERAQLREHVFQAITKFV